MGTCCRQSRQVGVYFFLLQNSINSRLERCDTIDVVEFRCNLTNSLFYLDEKVVGKFTLLHFCLRLSRLTLIPERGQKRLLEMRSVGEVGLIVVFVCFNICDTQSTFNSYILVRQLLFRIRCHCCMSSKNNSLGPVWREALSFFWDCERSLQHPQESSPKHKVSCIYDFESWQLLSSSSLCITEKLLSRFSWI